MEAGSRQSVSFKYTDSIQRPGAGAWGLGKMVTNTEVSAQDKAADGKDLDARDPGMGRGSNRARPCMISCMKLYDIWSVADTCTCCRGLSLFSPCTSFYC